MRKWKKGLEPLTEFVVEVVEVVVGDWVSLRGTGVFSTMVAASERTSKADSGATKPTLIPASKTGFCQSEALEKRIAEIQGGTVADWSKALHWKKMKNKEIPGSPPRATLFEESALSWPGQFFYSKTGFKWKKSEAHWFDWLFIFGCSGFESRHPQLLFLVRCVNRIK